MADSKDKVKFSIVSDGTSKGTKIVLNGENIIDSKSIVSCRFDAYAASTYPTYDGQIQRNPENICFSYMSIDKNEKGEKTFVRYEFNLAKDKYEPIITPLGSPAPEGEGGHVQDNLIGKDSELVQNILDFEGKTKRFIPSRDILVTRTQDSLKDMLEDLKKDI